MSRYAGVHGKAVVVVVMVSEVMVLVWLKVGVVVTIVGWPRCS